MAVIFNVVLPVLAGICIIGVIFFLVRAFSARARVERQAYGVGRVETRQKAQVNIIRAFVALALALLFLGIMAIGPRLAASLPAATATPSPTAAAPQESPTPTRSATATPTRSQPTPTSPVPTATPPPPPTATLTPEPLTATVTSGVGVYLRAEPTVEGSELEYLPDGVTLFVLEGEQTADDLVWQQVQTEEGQVGWVAADFITINQP